MLRGLPSAKEGCVPCGSNFLKCIATWRSLRHRARDRIGRAHDPPTHVREQHCNCNNIFGNSSTVPATFLVLCTRHTPGNKERMPIIRASWCLHPTATHGVRTSPCGAHTQISLQNILGLAVTAAGVSWVTYHCSGAGGVGGVVGDLCGPWFAHVCLVGRQDPSLWALGTGGVGRFLVQRAGAWWCPMRPQCLTTRHLTCLSQSSGGTGDPVTSVPSRACPRRVSYTSSSAGLIMYVGGCDLYQQIHVR